MTTPIKDTCLEPRESQILSFVRKDYSGKMTGLDGIVSSKSDLRTILRNTFCNGEPTKIKKICFSDGESAPL